jgi:membrane dipeptidase
MQGTPLEDRWGGLSAFGEAAIVEMNRLGIVSASPTYLSLLPLTLSQMVDLSHTSPATCSQALSLSRSPPIFSHSNARGMHPSVRNIPDSLLRRIGGTLPEPSDGEGGMGWGGNGTVEAVRAGDALISLNFSPPFISDEGADVIALASTSPSSSRGVCTERMGSDHADYIGRLAGRHHVGIGSDFDGIATTPKGLEDASRYPFLIAELIRRGWTDKEIIGVSGGQSLPLRSWDDSLMWLG